MASQSCDRRPRVIGRAVTRIRPSRTARTKLVLFSTPTTASPRAIASSAAPVEQTVSIAPLCMPPCTIP